MKHFVPVFAFCVFSVMPTYSVEHAPLGEPLHEATIPMIELHSNASNAKICSYQLQHFDFHYKPETANPTIIMLGNSMVRSTDWVKLLERDDVINRGIAGDKIKCICERTKYLKGKGAKIWIIEGGINDLPAMKTSEILKQFDLIVDFVKSENAIPVIVSPTFVSPRAKLKLKKDVTKTNLAVADINQKLIRYCDSTKTDLINLNMKLSENGSLVEKYTTDGVHFTDEAKLIWAKEILSLLKKHKI